MNKYLIIDVLDSTKHKITKVLLEYKYTEIESFFKNLEPNIPVYCFSSFRYISSYHLVSSFTYDKSYKIEKKMRIIDNNLFIPYEIRFSKGGLLGFNSFEAEDDDSAKLYLEVEK